jgi:hypothetical protein
MHVFVRILRSPAAMPDKDKVALEAEAKAADDKANLAFDKFTEFALESCGQDYQDELKDGFLTKEQVKKLMSILNEKVMPRGSSLDAIAEVEKLFKGESRVSSEAFRNIEGKAAKYGSITWEQLKQLIIIFNETVGNRLTEEELEDYRCEALGGRVSMEDFEKCVADNSREFGQVIPITTAIRRIVADCRCHGL